MSVLYPLLVPRYVSIYPPPLARALSRKRIRERPRRRILCRLTPPLCPRTTPKTTRRHHVPHMLPLFAHDRAETTRRRRTAPFPFLVPTINKQRGSVHPTCCLVHTQSLPGLTNKVGNHFNVACTSSYANSLAPIPSRGRGRIRTRGGMDPHTASCKHVKPQQESIEARYRSRTAWLSSRFF